MPPSERACPSRLFIRSLIIEGVKTGLAVEKAPSPAAAAAEAVVSVGLIENCHDNGVLPLPPPPPPLQWQSLSAAAASLSPRRLSKFSLSLSSEPVASSLPAPFALLKPLTLALSIVVVVACLPHSATLPAKCVLSARQYHGGKSRHNHIREHKQASKQMYLCFPFSITRD